MKGVILATGLNSEFYPSVQATNRYLLPVFDKPMITYPIETLKASGIKDILIILSPENAGNFLSVLGNGDNFGVRFTYKIHTEPNQPLSSLALAENFVHEENMTVILANQVFENHFFETLTCFKKGAQIFGKSDPNSQKPERILSGTDQIVYRLDQETKKSDLVPTGFFCFDSTVFEKIQSLQAKNQTSSDKKEDFKSLLKLYIQEKSAICESIYGDWVEINNHEDLLEASILAQEASTLPQKRDFTVERSPKVLAALPKITIGIATYNSQAYIEPCLRSLSNQDYKNLEIIIFDNGSIDETVAHVRSKFPQVHVIESEENIGFSRAHNEIIRNSKGEFYGCFNVDMVFEKNFCTILSKNLIGDPKLGSTGGKLKRLDFDLQNSDADNTDGKTNFIDSVGIRMLRSHRFEDIGQGEVDYGQYNESKEIFGISGAAVLFRREALEDTAFINQKNEQKEYFDECMFIYKEDIDLAYRLQWAGWKSKYVPQAIAYHDRTIPSLGRSIVDVVNNREKKTTPINRMSYLNHNILLGKNFSDSFSFPVQLATFWWNMKVFFYLLFFETMTLGQWWKYLKLRGRIKKQRAMMPKRVSQQYIEKLMERR